MDSMMKVNETLRLHETFRDKMPISPMHSGHGIPEDDASRSIDICSVSVEPPQSIGPPLVTADMLRRRYPRFCAGLTLTEQIVAGALPRSDVWLMHMIEGSYDDAMEASLKTVSSARRRKRCGLQLGALDAFSLVATRFIARIYR